ncbi:hypothetical protein HQO38_22010 [Rhodococcus fascians]|nr:hypothetical protein [Rhodococcus fascians]MBY4140025.1 hypothetical protein [Rhodococcus fascians]MBY4218345.1 hypothetical protein [Rhodococcus fascians]MBY4222317.1 hypothetical protein [Rhodococcus fascians]MBY4234587.1 hypothetical protein [Rhodococcus fascians]
MIWVTWRQFRATILFGVLTPLLLAAITIAVTVIGGGVIPSPYLQNCRSFDSSDCTVGNMQTIAILSAIVLPVVLGAFVGVTVFSRDLERRTHVLGLSQSVSRRRWYSVRILVVFAPIVGAMTVLGCVLFAAKYNTAPDTFAMSFAGSNESRLDFPIFGATGFVAGAYTAVGLMVGSACALAMRNTIAAMITTVIVSTAFLALLPTQLREHYATPQTDRVSVEQKVNDVYGGTPDYYRPGDSISLVPRWEFSADYVDSNGSPVPVDLMDCNWTQNYRDLSEFETVAEYEEYSDRQSVERRSIEIQCIRDQGAEAYETRYHEDRSFWRFQAIESALSLVVAGLLGGVSLLLLRRLRP